MACVLLFINLFINSFSHYYIVVMNVTGTSPMSPGAISDDKLKPYSGPKLLYVAAVLTSDDYNASQSYTLGSFTSATEFKNITFLNTPLTIGVYRCFVRAFTVGPVS